MGNKRKVRRYEVDEPVQGRGRTDRWEEKRRRFSDDRRGSKPLGPAFYLTIGGIAIAVIFVALMTFNGGATTASAAVLQQVSASTASTQSGKVGITVQEVQEKKLVYWDYKNPSTGKTTPLIAYVTPSGAVKVAIRMCEPCNGYTFRVEGNQIVCNTCGTRWDLETSKGISGGCQGYPPEVLPSSIADGQITVDEGKVSSWAPRV